MFDIIIPILKMKPRYLHDCLNSLKAQQYKKFKCYIIDGSPKDWEHYKESMKVIKGMMKGDKRFEYHRHPNLDEPYVSESQNYGLSLGSNPYVQFLGGDDFFYPHHLISMKDAIDAEVDENVGFWFCMVRANDKTLLDFQTFKVGRVKSYLQNHYLMYPYLQKELYPIFHYGNPIYMNGLILTRKLVEQVGGFNKEYRIGEDIDMILKIVKNEKYGRFLPYVGAYLRVHNEQTTNHEKMDSLSYENKMQWQISLAKKRLAHIDCEVGWEKSFTTIEEFINIYEPKWKNDPDGMMKEEGSLPITNNDEKIIDMERVAKLLGKKITPSEYELLKGMTSGTYHYKTIHELTTEEKLFLLRDDDEEKKFMENDIVI